MMQEIFSYFIPNEFKSTLQRYLKQLSQGETSGDKKLFQRWIVTAKVCISNMKTTKVGKTSEYVGQCFKLKEKLTMYFVQRTSETLVANSGMTLLNL